MGFFLLDDFKYLISFIKYLNTEFSLFGVLNSKACCLSTNETSLAVGGQEVGIPQGT